MKTIVARYTFNVTRTIPINDDPPAPYEQEEWEKQQVDEVGMQLADMIDSNDWFAFVM